MLPQPLSNNGYDTHTMGLRLRMTKDLGSFEQKKQREINTRVRTEKLEL